MTYANKIKTEFKEWYENCYCSWVFFISDWDRHIYYLCKRIDYTLNAYGFDRRDICVSQVKSKFGELRFYVDNLGIPFGNQCLNDIYDHITNTELACM